MKALVAALILASCTPECRAVRCDLPDKDALSCSAGSEFRSICLVDGFDASGLPSAGRYLLSCDSHDLTKWPECS